MVLGPDATIQGFLNRLQSSWKCSQPEWLGDKSAKFCGFQLRRTTRGIHMGQGDYAKELCERHACGVTRPVPMSASLSVAFGEAEMEENHTVPDREEVRKAQALTGELLWLSVRTRPDLSYVVDACLDAAGFANELGTLAQLVTA